MNDMRIPVAVLEDGRRVISESGLKKILGEHRSGSHWKRILEGSDSVFLPNFLSATIMRQFIDWRRFKTLGDPILYKPRVGRVTIGVRAELMHDICEAWLKARVAGVLKPHQLPIADRASMILKDYDRDRLIAAIDERTGYLDNCNRETVMNLLSETLSKEYLDWARLFPDEFYKRIHLLRGCPYPNVVPGGTSLGSLVAELAFDPLPPTVLEKLKEQRPLAHAMRKRCWKDSALCCRSIGQPDLRDHMIQLLVLMRVSSSWSSFVRLFRRAFPRHTTGRAGDLDSPTTGESSTYEPVARGRRPRNGLSRIASVSRIGSINEKEKRICRED